MSTRCSQATIITQLIILLRLNEFMQKRFKKSIEQLDRISIEAFINELNLKKEKKEIRQRTIKRYMINIGMFSKWLRREKNT